MKFDLVSGTEVPEAEIIVTPAMIEAGQWAIADRIGLLSDELTTIYRAMRRAELAEGGR